MEAAPKRHREGSPTERQVALTAENLGDYKIAPSTRLGKAQDAAHLLGVSTKRAYEILATLPQGIVVRLGPRQIRVNLDLLTAWIEKGGAA